MSDKYEQAAIDYDRTEIDRLKDHLRLADPSGELSFIGKGLTVTDWAISLLPVPNHSDR